MQNEKYIYMNGRRMDGTFRDNRSFFLFKNHDSSRIHKYYLCIYIYIITRMVGVNKHLIGAVQNK